MSDKTLRERFEIVVQATQTNILSYLKTVDSSIQRVHFQYGHPKMVIDALKSLATPQANQFLKYPLIAVFEDFPERSVIEGLDIITPKIIIAWKTQAHYTREQRDTLNFKPILNPLTDEFVLQLRRSPYFSTNYKKVGERIARPFWGKEGLYGNEGNVFDDMLDCIELRGFELTIRHQATCSPGFTKNF